MTHHEFNKAKLSGEMLRFIIVGIFNTILGIITMFGFYEWLGLGYWGASSLSYISCSIVSFFLNSRFTFNTQEALGTAAWRFAKNITVCYFMAYSIAKPLVFWSLSLLNFSLSIAMLERIALLFGMGIFTVLNFIGQKIFVFNSRK